MLVWVPQKSHNILLASDGTAKIADVGLARILNQVGLFPMPSHGAFVTAAAVLQSLVW